MHVYVCAALSFESSHPCFASFLAQIANSKVAAISAPSPENEPFEFSLGPPPRTPRRRLDASSSKGRSGFSSPTDSMTSGSVALSERSSILEPSRSVQDLTFRSTPSTAKPPPPFETFRNLSKPRNEATSFAQAKGPSGPLSRLGRLPGLSLRSPTCAYAGRTLVSRSAWISNSGLFLKKRVLTEEKDKLAASSIESKTHLGTK